jgi:hypothetical protein
MSKKRKEVYRLERADQRDLETEVQKMWTEITDKHLTRATVAELLGKKLNLPKLGPNNVNGAAKGLRLVWPRSRAANGTTGGARIEMAERSVQVLARCFKVLLKECGGKPCHEVQGILDHYGTEEDQLLF